MKYCMEAVCTPQNGDNLKHKTISRNEDNLKKEDDLKNGDDKQNEVNIFFLVPYRFWIQKNCGSKNFIQK